MTGHLKRKLSWVVWFLVFMGILILLRMTLPESWIRTLEDIAGSMD
jgi:hypothetical protein